VKGWRELIYFLYRNARCTAIQTPLPAVIIEENEKNPHRETYKMKRIHLFGLIIILLMPLLALGCDTEVPTKPETSDLPTIPENETLELSCDDFESVSHMTKVIDLVKSGTLTVTLCSNPSTGFQWNADAEISDTSVIKQDSHEFIQPLVETDEMITGAPGKEVWVFKALSEGTATISFSYSRPWEGGEKDVWTLDISVTVN
jgi:inhibitor of cysteine peptidase